jgi:hypothetical protein
VSSTICEDCRSTIHISPRRLTVEDIVRSAARRGSR